jgi:mannose-6-phosphate isomerase-like protein (cupin superfamily)
MGRIANITQQAIDNTYFRHVILTDPKTQIVIMSIPAGGEIGLETHPDNDQVLYLVQGHGRSIVGGDEQPFAAAADAGLKIITIYTPPHHPDGLIHKTKAEADAEGN